MMMGDSSAFIKSSAKDEGFDLVGIAPSQFLSGESSHLKEWLNRGYHGTMSWMENNFEKRTDPERAM
ncbi:MAG: hypothetical protein ACLP05_08935 [Candidatus Kryptoniota bacterium]